MDSGGGIRWGTVLGVTAVMAGARALDLGITAILDRSLAGEQNLLHQAFGAGLGAIAAVNAAVLLVLAALVARSTRLDPLVAKPPPGLGMRGFLDHFLFAGYHPWWSIVYRRPGRTRAQWLLGRMVPWPAVGISLLAVAGNLLAYGGGAPAAVWHALIGSPWRLVGTFAVAILAILAAWAVAEFGLYRLAGSSAAPAAA